MSRKDVGSFGRLGTADGGRDGAVVSSTILAGARARLCSPPGGGGRESTGLGGSVSSVSLPSNRHWSSGWFMAHAIPRREVLQLSKQKAE